MKLGQLDAALPMWRMLARGLESGSTDWVEAKYNLIICLAESDEAAAAQVYQQTTQLMGELPSPWLEKFSELKRRFNQSDGE